MVRLIYLLLILSALASCGSNSPDSPPLAETTESAATAGTTESPTAAGTPQDISGSACGEITIQGSPTRPTNPTAAGRAAACLADAFRSCTANSLTIREPNTKIIREFTVVPGSPCILRQTLYMDPESPGAVADCGTVRTESNNLIVEGCSHLGDFILTLSD